MLGKLLKYEMKASARTLLPLYGAALVVAILLAVQVGLQTSELQALQYAAFYGESFRNQALFFSGLCTLLGAICVAIVVLTALIVIQRFAKGLLGQEGYLLFTLPVTRTQLLASCLLAAMLWIVIGSVVIGLAWAVILLPAFTIAEVDFWNEVQYLWSYWGHAMPVVAGQLLSGLANLVVVLLVVYLSCLIGQMEQLRQHQIVASVIAFFGIQWVVGSLEHLVYRLVLGAGSYGFGLLPAFDMESLMLVTAMEIGLAVVEAVALFFANLWFMNHKLNL